MEAKVFFSKSSNIFSVAILLAGLSTFGAGVKISETNEKDMQKQHEQMVRQEQKIESLQYLLDKEKINVKLQKQKSDTQYEQVNELQKELHKLRQDNDVLKKKVTTYQNRSESPSSVTSSRSTPNKGEKGKRKVNVIATAYTANCDTGCTGITATGLNVRSTTKHNGATVISVDPSIIPLHSVVRVDTSSGESFLAVAEDTGGAINGGHIDVLVSSHSQAIQFGRQSATLTILREGD
jgi:3D (Asp-Asp-Asp) domain-containing protein